MTSPAIKQVKTDVKNFKADSVPEEVIKAPYTLDKVKKMNEMKDNLKRTNIHEQNKEDDVYTFKIKPGCYSEIMKKFKESVIGDEINDESAGTDSPVGVKMKLVEVKGIEEQEGARVTTQFSWKVTDTRTLEVAEIKQFLYHSTQTIMLHGGRMMGKKTTVQLCADLIRPIMTRIISEKKLEILRMRNGIHGMDLRKRTSGFKCEECEFQTNHRTSLESHMRLYHGHTWTQVKRSYSGKSKIKSKEVKFEDQTENKFVEENSIGYIGANVSVESVEPTKQTPPQKKTEITRLGGYACV